MLRTMVHVGTVRKEVVNIFRDFLPGTKWQVSVNFAGPDPFVDFLYGSTHCCVALRKLVFYRSLRKDPMLAD